MGGLWAVWRAATSSKVSLVFVEYRKMPWPKEGTNYAELRLINGTKNAVGYPVIRDGDWPLTLPVLFREKGSEGWTQSKPDPPSTGVVTIRGLEPGQSVTFVVRVRRGDLPKQVGVSCRLPAFTEISRLTNSSPNDSKQLREAREELRKLLLWHFREYSPPVETLGQHILEEERHEAMARSHTRRMLEKTREALQHGWSRIQAALNIKTTAANVVWCQKTFVLPDVTSSDK